MYIKKLAELNKDSLATAGGKGANLGELIRAGLPVPDGFVITTDAYRAYGQGNASAVEKAIKAAFRQMPSGAVAVRSSATAEDLPTASFAGQMETYLGIYGEEAVLENVKKCWDSLHSERAISYRQAGGFADTTVSIAVVVQSMIAADAAGVMFTANPVNGRRDEILISASYGLGETVVSGLVTPDTFILSKNGQIKSKTLGSKESKIVLTAKGAVEQEVPPPERALFCLGKNELAQLAVLSQKVEKHYGAPMDTEWAVASGKVYLLQARPITTELSPDLSVLEPGDEIIYQGENPPFGYQSVLEHSSDPLTPLDCNLFCIWYDALNGFYQNMGFIIPPGRNKTVERASGCIAIDFIIPEPPPGAEEDMPPLPENTANTAPVDTKDVWRPVAADMDAWMHKTDHAADHAQDATELAKLAQKAMLENGALFHQRISEIFMPGIANALKMDRWIEQTLGPENLAELQEGLMRALPFRTALQNEAIIKLAQAAKENGRESREFQREWDEFIAEYGDRPSSGMGPLLGSPTWSEKPENIQQLLDALLSDPSSLDAEAHGQKQQADFERAKQRIAQELSASQYQEFLADLERARSATIVREESLFYLEKIVACLRRLFLRFGRILAQQGAIRQADDVFYILFDEFDAVANGSLELKERLEKRKTAYQKVCAAHENGLHWLIATGSFPEFATETAAKNTATIGDDGAIQGISASRGVYEGVVCIVHGPSEFNKLKKGEILVSTYTAPVWTPLFRVAGAVVTEIGSAGSHAAIVSREYGIPCVVDIPNLTHMLKDRQKVRVDGTKGTITILPELPEKTYAAMLFSGQETPLFNKMMRMFLLNPVKPLDFSYYRHRCTAAMAQRTDVSPDTDPLVLWKPVAAAMNAWLKNHSPDFKTALSEFEAIFSQRFSLIDAWWAAEKALDELLKKAVSAERLASIRAELFRALPYATSLQNEALLALAQSEHPERLDEFLAEYGGRSAESLTAMLSAPTLHEKPEMIRQLIALLQTSGSRSQDEATDFANAKLEVQEKLTPEDYAVFEEVLTKARNGVIAREESSFLTEKMTAEIRKIALELGDTLLHSGCINERDDVFFLFEEEIGAAIIKDEIERRKIAYAKTVAAHHNGVNWLTGKQEESVRDENGAIKGEAASTGVYEGLVCVVNDPSEFGKLKKGEILVAPYTSPTWTPLFKVAGAAICERGSAGSHAAIVSREYGMPCVVALPNIMNMLKDGQKVRVDGANGTVTVLQP